MGAISDFIRHHYRHFNGAALVDAADAYVKHLADGGQMLVTLAGAMSTAELGLSLAEMIRRGKVHAICCTGANLEEDVFNLVAHDHYVRIPNYRHLTAEQEEGLLDRHLNRVTDTCIPEFEAIRRIEGAVLEEWQRADKAKQQFFPHEFMYKILLLGRAEAVLPDRPEGQLAARGRRERNLPMIVPGWEDSTLGNIFAGALHLGRHQERAHGAHRHRVHDDVWRTGTRRPAEQVLDRLLPDRRRHRGRLPDLRRADARSRICGSQTSPRWGYFCQISDSTTSYGSYSGAVPNEKITWGKLSASTPKFIIESDATIVAPLIFAHVLGE